MAWYSGIVKKAKSVHKKIDTSLGGYLPGGQTPDQIAQAKKTEATKKLQIPSKTPAILPTKVVDPGKATVQAIQKQTADKKEQTRQIQQPQPSRSLDIPSKSPQIFPTQIEDPVEQVLNTLETQTDRNEKGQTLKEWVNNVKEEFAKRNVVEEGAPDVELQTWVGMGGLVSGVLSNIKNVLGSTKVKTLAKVGTKGNLQTTLTGANAFKVNTKTNSQTETWLSKLTTHLSNPAASIGLIMATIGSYPFAGFIKEEALQTASFGVKTAIDNGDIEGAKLAIEQQKEMLDPSLWDEIKGKIPFVNVLDKLDDFYESARIKVAIDERVIGDMLIKQQNNENDDETYKRIDDERTEKKEIERQKDEIYYDNIQKQVDARRKRQREEDAEYYKNLSAQQAATAIKKRNEDTAYWEKVMEDREKESFKKRKAEEDYWNAYFKELDRIRTDNSPSNLKFGLL